MKSRSKPKKERLTDRQHIPSIMELLTDGKIDEAKLDNVQRDCIPGFAS